MLNSLNRCGFCQTIECMPLPNRKIVWFCGTSYDIIGKIAKRMGHCHIPSRVHSLVNVRTSFNCSQGKNPPSISVPPITSDRLRFFLFFLGVRQFVFFFSPRMPTSSTYHECTDERDPWSSPEQMDTAVDVRTFEE